MQTKLCNFPLASQCLEVLNLGFLKVCVGFEILEEEQGASKSLRENGSESNMWLLDVMMWHCFTLPHACMLGCFVCLLVCRD